MGDLMELMEDYNLKIGLSNFEWKTLPFMKVKTSYLSKVGYYITVSQPSNQVERFILNF